MTRHVSVTLPVTLLGGWVPLIDLTCLHNLLTQCVSVTLLVAFLGGWVPLIDSMHLRDFASDPARGLSTAH
jgi:hypothetical protein